MLTTVFSSLRIRDFRIYYFGQVISTTGTWMQNVAQAWLVYRITESSFYLGLVGFVGLLPVLIFGLAGGVVADRYPRRNLLVAAQAVALIQAFLLAALALTGAIETWHIVVLAFMLGLVHAFEMPSRHSFIAEIVPRSSLSNAIALNSTVFNSARFLGPAIAGWLVAIFDEGVVFFINGWTFLAVLLGLLAIPLRPIAVARGARHSTLGEAVKYAHEHRLIRAALLLLGAVSLVSTSYSILMPVFVKEVFQGGAGHLGLLLGSSGAGALLAALRLAYLSGKQNINVNIGKAAMGAGAGMMLFAANGSLWIAPLLLAATGFALTTLVASINTLIQLTVEDGKRGRVMAFFSVLFIGTTSLGNLMAGTAARYLGAPATVLSFGLVALLAGGIHLWRAGGGPDGGNQALVKPADGLVTE